MKKQNETSEYVPSCQFQNGESVRLGLGHYTNLPARIVATKLTETSVYYDLQVWLYPPEGEAGEPDCTRLYHIESRFVFELEEIKNIYPQDGNSLLPALGELLRP